jgi:hypothetical protein
MVQIEPRPAAANNWASREYRDGRRERKVGAILHWMAGYLPGTTAIFQNPATGYSTNLGVGSRDGKGNGLEVHRYVPADGYAFGSYNEDADRRGESIEIENDWPNSAGKPTPEVHELVARLLAQLAVDEDWPLIGGRRQLVLGDFPDHRFYRRPIPDFGKTFNVTTHRSMALKDCPGSTDVEWIVRRGNEILAGNGGSQPATRKRKEETMHLAHIPNGAPNGKDHLFLQYGEKFYMEFVGQAAANAIASQIGGGSAPGSRSFFDAIKRAQGITRKVEVVILDDDENAGTPPA